MRERLVDWLKRPWGAALDPALRRLVLEAARRRRTEGLARGRLDALYQTDDGVRPLLLGHRGAMAYAPENTLGAFRAALLDGANGFELDVQLSADAVPVVLHDDTLDRTSKRTGKPVRYEAAELDDIDVGTWFGSWAFEKVPRLLETFELAHALRPYRAVINVELKGPTPLSLGLERRVVEAVRRYADRVRVIVSSFHPAQLLAVQQLAPEIPTALLLAKNSVMPLRTGWAAPLLMPDALHPPSAMVDAGFVAAAHQAGMRVHAWAVADADDAMRLVSLGVDGLIVDDVRDIRAALDHRYGVPPRDREVASSASSPGSANSRATAL
jgi:glycerophosphoryl diester phosphodiesterase